MEHVLREDFTVISDKWLTWLKAQYYPDMQEREFASVVSDGIAGRGFNAKPSLYIDDEGNRTIFFVGNRGGYSSVFQVPVDSLYQPQSAPKQVVKGERSDRFESFHLFESRLGVSSDGVLAFVTKSGARDVIHLYDAKKEKVIETLDFEQLTAVYSPNWSPDSRRLVFSSIDHSGFADLYVYDTVAETLTRLTDDHYDDRDPAWSPDGTQIAFSSDRTSNGDLGSYNLFTYELESSRIDYITSGSRMDMAPRWSPDGKNVIFASTSRGEGDRFESQNIWVAELGSRKPFSPPVASASGIGLTKIADLEYKPTVLRRLTTLASAAFDPLWTPDDRIVFASFEGFRFSVRSLDDLDSLRNSPKEEIVLEPAMANEPWTFEKIGTSEGATDLPYKKRYRLDIAQGQISQTASLGTFGGAVLAFSDMLSNDYLYLTLANSANSRRSFIRDLSFSVTRVQTHRRANFAYGVYRFSGRRYDLTDPDASTSLPIFYETIYGAQGGISYPLSKFRRVEVNTSFSSSNKEVLAKQRKALLLSNSVSLIHDTALYSHNGPIDGWRAGVTAGYTTDVKYSNVSYFTGIADVRLYRRIVPGVTFATRATGRWNQGREARMFIAGGSWDIRGFKLFRVRGQKMWLTSTELRFPLVNAPYLITPILAPFGIASLRGAVFFDAAHAWNDDYHRVFREINSGETIGSIGTGLRLNLFNAFILRYDIGYRYRDGFKHRERFFKQFFFGIDF